MSTPTRKRCGDVKARKLYVAGRRLWYYNVGAMTSAHAVIRLYPGRAPGSENWTQREHVKPMPSWFGRAAFNVTDPTLTVFAPEPGTANGMAMAICPGGGFVGLSIDNEGADVARWLAGRGVTCFMVKYRVLASPPGNPEAAYAGLTREEVAARVAQVLPLAHADALTVMRYVRANAGEYGIDPARIGIMGFSAGGTLTASVAFVHDAESRPDFVAPIYLQYHWALKAPAPTDGAPMFLAAASDDELWLGSHSVRLYTDWIDVGKSAELHMFARGRHGFAMREQGLPVDAWIERFWEWLMSGKVKT